MREGERAELEALRRRVRELEDALRNPEEGPGHDFGAPYALWGGAAHFLRGLVSTIPDMIWLKDPEGVFLMCNEAFERLYDAGEKDILGKTDYDFVDREQADAFRRHDVRAVELGGPSVNEEWVTLAATGETKLLETIKTPIHDDVGSLVGVLGIARDITDRHRQEAALHKSEERFRLLFSEMDAGVALHEIVCDGEGVPVDFVFLEVNPAFERITGRSREELVGHRASELVDVGEPHWIQLFGEVALGGRSVEFEQYSHFFKRWYKVRAYSPKKGQFATISTDVSRVKLAEETLRTAADITAAIPAGLFVCSLAEPDGLRLESANPEAERLVGIDAGEWAGRDLGELWPQVRDEGLRDRFVKPMRSGGIFEGGDVALGSGGAARFYRVRTFKLPGHKLGVAFEDTTKRRRAEDELARLYNISQDLVCVADLETATYLKVNPAFTRVLGYAEDEIVGRPISDFVHPDDQEATARIVADRLRAGRDLVGFENRIRTKSGEYRILEWESHPIIAENRTYAIAKDVTEARRTQEALSKRLIALTQPLDDTGDIELTDLFNLGDLQRLQDEFANATGVASLITDAEGRPITRPSNFCRLCRLIRHTEKGRENCSRSDEVIGRMNAEGPNVQVCLSGGLWDAGASISVGGRQIARWLVGQVRDETQTEEGMAAYAREIGLDEEEFLEAFRKVPAMSHEQFTHVAEVLFTLAGQLSSIAYQNVQQARFITELKATRGELLESVEALNRAKTLLASVIEQSPIPMALVNAGALTMQMLNPACASLLGVRGGEACVGCDVRELRSMAKVYTMDRRLLPLEELPFATAPGGASTRDLEVRIVRRDGQERVAALYGAPVVDDRGELIAGLVVLVDVTERKRSEEIMIQTEKMMSVGGLAAGMAHEINNPLGSILGGVQNCLRRLSPGLERNRAEARRLGLDIDALHAYLDSRGVLGFLEGIRDSGVRASEIVRNMLDFSRSSGSSRSPSNLNELLDKAVALASSDYDLKKRYDFRQVEIVRAYDPDLPAAMVYETEVEQVFLNLLKNAAQAMPDVADPGHRPRLDLETFVEGGMVVVRIADNGPGMDDETRKRVFEPFFTTKPPGVGTGLGLSVSYFIITENHGGSFEVQSQSGRGTSFTVRLPLSAR